VSTVPAFVEARRSIRAFAPDAVPRADLDAIVEAACLAPAPHHSRPWRFVVVDTEASKRALALPVEWLPHALVLVGRPDPAYVGRARPPVPLDEIRRFA
jgi:nitroreductase